MKTKTNKIWYGTFDADKLKEYPHTFTNEEINEMTKKISDAVNIEIEKQFNEIWHVNDITTLKTGDVLTYEKNGTKYIFEVTFVHDNKIYYKNVYNVQDAKMYRVNVENLVVQEDEIPLLYRACELQRKKYYDNLV